MKNQKNLFRGLKALEIAIQTWLKNKIPSQTYEALPLRSHGVADRVTLKLICLTHVKRNICTGHLCIQDKI